MTRPSTWKQRAALMILMVVLRQCLFYCVEAAHDEEQPSSDLVEEPSQPTGDGEQERNVGGPPESPATPAAAVSEKTDHDEPQPAASTEATTTTAPPPTGEQTTEVPIVETTPEPTSTTTTPQLADITTPTKKPIECIDTKYCFNGGKCILNELSYPQCICTEGFYGARCQTKDICKSVIVDSLTGDQICAKLDRGCFKNDKFFRCSCHEDEYFIFKTLTQDSSNLQMDQLATQSDQMASRLATNQAAGGDRTVGKTPNAMPGGGNLKRSKSAERLYDLLNQPDSATFTYDIGDLSDEETLPGGGEASAKRTKQKAKRSNSASYLAECRKIDKCLGMRCKQLSEVCLEGQCVCNRDAGYVGDPTDGGVCKLLDPCTMPSEEPICGQAQCVATFGRDLFRCLCPIGHVLVQIGATKSSSVCAPLSNAICDSPLLNKCQHLCHIDLVQNNYRCSCFRGYKSGKRAGIDDHMCFFDEHANVPPDDTDVVEQLYGGRRDEMGDADDNGGRETVFRWYEIPQLGDPRFLNASSSSSPGSRRQSRFSYDPNLQPVPANEDQEEELEEENEKEGSRTGTLLSDSNVKSLRPDKYVIRREPSGVGSSGAGGQVKKGARDSWDDWDASVAKMSAQERCNKMCGENRICVLSNGSQDSYRCICDRQGYVSVGDKCLDWCAAAEFSLRIRELLFNYGCWTQVCKLTASDSERQFWDGIPAAEGHQKVDPANGRRDEEEQRLVRLSSWRPQFECDCSSSPYLKQNPNTRLCQLDFRATLEPCLPGNVGYIDCVENKNAYCAVLHRNVGAFVKDLIHDKYKDFSLMRAKGGGEEPSSSSSNSSSKSKAKQAKHLLNEKLYTCVCSPDKKFLVDKPRNKERCVDECNMLNIECVRFNRMCRSASIAPDDFGWKNLVRKDRDGAVKMNFRRTSCECLPGFNVGPTESVDFTLDDEPAGPSPAGSDSQAAKLQQQADQAATGAQNSKAKGGPDHPIGYLMPDFVDSEDILDQAEHMSAKYINIDSSCLLDYDVVEFHASFKSPADFDPSWIKIRNPPPELPNRAKNSEKGGANSGGAEGNSTSREPIRTETGAGHGEPPVSSSRSHHQSSNETGFSCDPKRGCQLRVPKFMQYNISDLHKNIVLVAQCEPAAIMSSLEAYQECLRYRYWIIQKLRRHYVDWRGVITRYLSETFDLMDGNIRLRVNRCESTLKSVSVLSGPSNSDAATNSPTVIPDHETGASAEALAQPRMVPSEYLDPLDPHSMIDADIDCELTLHSASDGSSPRYSRKVLLEKQLQRFIFAVEPATRTTAAAPVNQRPAARADASYYLMAPNMLIRRESFDQLAEHRKLFNPCESDYAYCDMQTECHMVDTVNFTCTCKVGYTPIGSRDIYYGDSRKEVCEDIDECLFDVCRDLAGVADCENTIGDYRCVCRGQYTGNNKNYCNHVCNTINCHHLHGKCRIVAPHHALCECEDGYKEADCSVQDPNVALRKANMIIVGSIFTSVLLLMITLAISLNSQLKKTKKKLKQLETISSTANLFELHTPQPFRQRLSKAG